MQRDEKGGEDHGAYQGIELPQSPGELKSLAKVASPGSAVAAHGTSAPAGNLQSSFHRPNEEGQSIDGTIRVASGSGFRKMKPFPWRLHEMLEEIEKKKLDWIVSWLPDGQSFQVHNQEAFSETIIPMYFRHTRYKSFQRQLYLYGFRCLPEPPSGSAKGKSSELSGCLPRLIERKI